MSKFKNIEALGLSVEKGVYNTLMAKAEVCHVIKASDLESLLEKGVRVYGLALDEQFKKSLGTCEFYGHTHTGLLIAYKPIPKPQKVSKEEVLHAIYSLKYGTGYSHIESIAKRIEESGIEG